MRSAVETDRRIAEECDQECRDVYIVDDDEITRELLSAIVSDLPDCNVRTFSGGREFLYNLEALPGGSLLLDMQMPCSDGFDVLEAIRNKPRFASIVITANGSVDVAVKAMKIGAVDFIEKGSIAPERLLSSVRKCLTMLTEKSSELALREEAKAKIASLSQRERDVLEGLVAGHSNKIIAYELDISPRTVEVYRSKLMDKFEVRTFSEALRIAFHAGLHGD